MKNKTKHQQLAHEDLAAAVIAHDDEEAGFFLEGLEQARRDQERREARASLWSLRTAG